MGKQGHQLGISDTLQRWQHSGWKIEASHYWDEERLCTAPPGTGFNFVWTHISIMCQRLTHVVESHVQDMMLPVISTSIIRNRTTIREETLLCPGRLLRAISENRRNKSTSQSEPGKNLANIPDSMSVWLGKKKKWKHSLTWNNLLHNESIKQLSLL